MSKPTLIHRGYLYAQKRVPKLDPNATPSEHRMMHAVSWRAGFLAAQVEARRRAKTHR